MLTDYDALNRLLRIQDVQAILGLRSRQSIYNLIQAGLLPLPVKLGKRASAWHARDVYAFVQSRQVDPLARPVTLQARYQPEGEPLPTP